MKEPQLAVLIRYWLYPSTTAMCLPDTRQFSATPVFTLEAMRPPMAAMKVRTTMVLTTPNMILKPRGADETAENGLGRRWEFMRVEFIRTEERIVYSFSAGLLRAALIEKDYLVRRSMSTRSRKYFPSLTITAMSLLLNCQFMMFFVKDRI